MTDPTAPKFDAVANEEANQSAALDRAFPEHHKLLAVSDLSKGLGEFLEADGRAHLEDTYTWRELIDEYLGVDRAALDDERGDIIADLTGE